MKQDLTTLTISLPVAMRKKIEEAAKREHRSVSSFLRMVIANMITTQKAVK